MQPVRYRMPKLKKVTKHAGGIVYLPPGKGLEMRSWDRIDTDLWMACFLRPDLHPEVFSIATEEHLDGESIHFMATEDAADRPTDLKIPKEKYDLIIRSAVAVINEKFRVKYERELVEWKATRERERAERLKREKEREQRELMGEPSEPPRRRARREPSDDEDEEEEEEEAPAPAPAPPAQAPPAAN